MHTDICASAHWKSCSTESCPWHERTHPIAPLPRLSRRFRRRQVDALAVLQLERAWQILYSGISAKRRGNKGQVLVGSRGSHVDAFKRLPFQSAPIFSRLHKRNAERNDDTPGAHNLTATNAHNQSPL